MYSDITDAMLGAVARDPEHLALLRKLGMRSAIIVPMIARARTIGTISLVAGESGRRYHREDLIFAEEIARSAAFTVENARLYREATEAIGVREEFLSIASHELQTPLTALKLQLGAIRLKLARGPRNQDQGLLRWHRLSVAANRSAFQAHEFAPGRFKDTLGPAIAYLGRSRPARAVERAVQTAWGLCKECTLRAAPAHQGRHVWLLGQVCH